MYDPVGQRTLEIMAQARHYNAWLYRQIKPYLVGQVAEVGSGTGTFTQMMVKDKYRVTTLDVNPEYLPQIVLDLQTTRSPRRLFAKFDTIVALNVVEHIKHANRAMANFKTMLKPGGRLIILVPAGKWAYGSLDKSLGHIKRYDRQELVELLSKAGFKIEVVRSLNLPGIWGWWWNSKITRRQVLPILQVKLFDYLSLPWLWIENLVRFPFGLSLLAVAAK